MKPIAEVVDGLCSDGVAFFELGDRHYRVSDLAFSVADQRELERERVERSRREGEGSWLD